MTFVKFVVSAVENPEEPTVAVPVMNAADVLMESSRRHAQEARRSSAPQLPQVISPESKKNYNKKDELFNAIVEVLKEREIFFPNASVANNEGKTVIGVLTDVLWHIDEHHEKIHQQSTQSKDVPSVPPLFSTFRGFNDSKELLD